MASGELSSAEKQRINATVARAEEVTGLEICVVLGAGDPENSRRLAERAFHKHGMHERPAVMIVVGTKARTLEIVVAGELSERLPDQACDEAVQLMTRMFGTGEIASGIEAGVDFVAERCGHVTDLPPDGPDLPNIVDTEAEDL